MTSTYVFRVPDYVQTAFMSDNYRSIRANDEAEARRHVAHRCGVDDGDDLALVAVIADDGHDECWVADSLAGYTPIVEAQRCEIVLFHKLYDEAIEALKALFEHCSMIHNTWGEGCNQREADAAIAAGRALLAKAAGKPAAEAVSGAHCIAEANGTATPGQIEEARSMYQTDNVAIESDAKVSMAPDGVWVAAWVWLDYAEANGPTVEVEGPTIDGLVQSNRMAGRE